MDQIEKFKKEIESIKERNKRVEKDKAWETSWTRRIAIAVSTYILILIFLYSIGADKPFLSAIIPAVAYMISSASLNSLKTWWLKNRNSP
ncbi:MAG: hypothetical protein A2857_03045 [Candidatus Levybacteria bacterium RIFCSPHIGHO2_01_FULL_36_15]|nr:MAG: hypothetical protein A2857_03045 [Candidatus Levybacteria bacterium RIFCSPHIGHO2_01_FULL_36_15]OGH37254.1 MAG: hypothetical protein A2905_05600 [Candidatus Levybacteria bacterium RIFCSPLOWO2_01_FULL_36_10]